MMLLILRNDNSMQQQYLSLDITNLNLETGLAWPSLLKFHV